MSSPLAYDDVQTRKNQLIRKALEGSAFIAPYSASAITTLTTGAAKGLAALPDGYEDCGWSTTDGVALSEAITSSDVTSWGSPDPTRSDITKRTTTAKIVCQETKALTIGLYTSADMSTVDPDPTTGEVSIEQALVPSKKYYRMLCLAVDLTDDGEFYVARFLPRVSVSDLDDQSYANGDDPIEWGITFTAYPDSTLGYSSRYIFGGPGFAALASDMGFSDESSSSSS